ncbi:MAG: TIM barrel protein [Variovorax sp.]
MQQEIHFAINRICASSWPFMRFAEMAQRLGVRAIELRNDLAGVELADGMAPREIAAIAGAHALTIRSINALQRFEQFDAGRAEEARALVRAAVESGAEALVLCPTNSHADRRSADQRHADLVHALGQLQPLLADHGLTGLVEALGFEECALRRKSQAVRAIDEIDGRATFALVHDTFHHQLAGEGRFFPELTGLVHISGVEAPALAIEDMRDAHRVLVGAADRLSNAAQVRTLLDAGYTGWVSYEPFAESVTTDPQVERQLAASMAFFSAAVAAAAGPEPSPVGL